jgi:hypothetical protein
MAALSKAVTDMLHRLNGIVLERSDQVGGMTVGITGIILGCDTVNPPNHLKGRTLKISAQQPFVDGVGITMVLSTDTFDKHEIMSAKLAASSSFWGDDWLSLLNVDEYGDEDFEMPIFVGMVSPWTSRHVFKAIFEAVDDPERQLAYLPYVILGYLKQETIFYELKECPVMDKVLQDISFFVQKHCAPYVQERYAQLMSERQTKPKRAKIDCA